MDYFRWDDVRGASERAFASCKSVGIFPFSRRPELSKVWLAYSVVFYSCLLASFAYLETYYASPGLGWPTMKIISAALHLATILTGFYSLVVQCLRRNRQQRGYGQAVRGRPNPPKRGNNYKIRQFTHIRGRGVERRIFDRLRYSVQYIRGEKS